MGLHMHSVTEGSSLPHSVTNARFTLHMQQLYSAKNPEHHFERHGYRRAKDGGKQVFEVQPGMSQRELLLDEQTVETPWVKKYVRAIIAEADLQGKIRAHEGVVTRDFGKEIEVVNPQQTWAGLGYHRKPSFLKQTDPAIPVSELGAADTVLLSHYHHVDNLDSSGRAYLPQAKQVLTTLAAAQ